MMPSSALVILLFAPFICAILLLALNNRYRRIAAWIAGSSVLVGAITLSFLWQPIFASEIVRTHYEWLPTLGVNFGLRMDGLAFLFALLIVGIGALVVLYGAYYLSADDPPARFFAYLMFFMGAMLGVVLADNLILLVVFWELTSLSSFLLIGFWRQREDARQGARMALAVTGGGGLALLAGAILIGHVVGSYDFDRVLASKDVLQQSPLFVPILILVLLGAFTKSAQFPFHFWLPHAMAAPTPVSAYLHSATMVKAGVFLLARFYPALGDNEAWFWIVSTAGLATLLLGAVAAIFQHDLKGLLAYSTISHLGLITLLFGLDTPLAVVAGLFHIINHAVFKASLFMAAGIIDHETGSRDMRQLNGLWKMMPITATLAMVAAASMAGVPLANGFLSKEMFFAETLSIDQYTLLSYATPFAATVAAIASVVYSLRFIHDVFFNGEPIGLTKTPHEPPRFMRVPVEMLVLLCLAIGIFPALTIAPLLAITATSTLNLSSAAELPTYSLAIWHGFNLPLLMSAIALVGGVAIYFVLQRRINLHTVPDLPSKAKRTFDVMLHNLQTLASAVTRRTQNGSLQRYVGLIFIVIIAGALYAVWLSPVSAGTSVTSPHATLLVLIVAAIGLLATFAVVIFHRQRIIALVFMGIVGLVVTLMFVYFSAPDLALTQLLVEIVTIILMMLALHFLPKTSMVETARGSVNWKKWRDGVIAITSGSGMTWLVYQVLTRPFDSISPYFLRTSVPEGGGANVVNVIIVDFRAFDTLGEIAVLGMAGLIVAVLLRDVDFANSPFGGQFEVKIPEKWRPSLMLQIISALILPISVMVAVYFYLRGHNLPGGGFIAGLVFAIAIILLYVAQGRARIESALPMNHARWIGCGLLMAGLTGFGSMVIGYPFMTSTYRYFDLPVVGDVPIASAMFFDLGVFLCVIGGTMLALATLAALHRPSSTMTNEVRS